MPLIFICEWICAHLYPRSPAVSNCSFDVFPSCLPGLVTGHGSHWSLSWTEVWPRFGDTLGTTSIWTSITGVPVGLWTLGRDWEWLLKQREPFMTMYVVRHHFSLGVVPHLVFFSSLKPEVHQDGKCVYASMFMTCRRQHLASRRASGCPLAGVEQ